MLILWPPGEQSPFFEFQFRVLATFLFHCALLRRPPFVYSDAFAEMAPEIAAADACLISRAPPPPLMLHVGL